jgi:hypothetical protein
MPQTCTICKNPDREPIEAALLGTESLRAIAARWSVSKSALVRHRADHLPAAIMKAAAVQEVISGGRLLDRLTALNRETLSILREARTGRTKDSPLALKAITRAEKQLELEGRLLGELNESTTVDLIATQEWQTLRVAILLAIEPYPAARAAVLGAITNVGA